MFDIERKGLDCPTCIFPLPEKVKRVIHVPGGGTSGNAGTVVKAIQHYAQMYQMQALSCRESFYAFMHPELLLPVDDKLVARYLEHPAEMGVFRDPDLVNDIKNNMPEISRNLRQGLREEDFVYLLFAGGDGTSYVISQVAEAFRRFRIVAVNLVNITPDCMPVVKNGQDISPMNKSFGVNAAAEWLVDNEIMPNLYPNVRKRYGTLSHAVRRGIVQQVMGRSEQELAYKVVRRLNEMPNIAGVSRDQVLLACCLIGHDGTCVSQDSTIKAFYRKAMDEDKSPIIIAPEFHISELKRIAMLGDEYGMNAIWFKAGHGAQDCDGLSLPNEVALIDTIVHTAIHNIVVDDNRRQYEPFGIQLSVEGNYVTMTRMPLNYWDMSCHEKPARVQLPSDLYNAGLILI